MACYMLFDDDDPDARAVSIMIIIVIISSTDLRRLPPMTFLAYRYERVKREGMIACCPIRTGRAREKYSYIATPSPQTPIRRRTIRFALVVGNDAGRRLLRLLQKLHRGHVVVCYHNKKVRTNSYASAEWRTATEANRGVLRWWNFRINRRAARMDIGPGRDICIYSRHRQSVRSYGAWRQPGPRPVRGSLA
jgi:hypothetical protein